MARKICPDCGYPWSSWPRHVVGVSLTCWANQAHNHCQQQWDLAVEDGWLPVAGWRAVLEKSNVPLRLVPFQPYAVPIYKDPECNPADRRIIGGIPKWEETPWAPWWAVHIARLGGSVSNPPVSVDKRVRLITLLLENPRERETLRVQASLVESAVHDLAEQLYAGPW